MMRKFVLGLIFIFVARSLFAETIVLKSGRTFEAEILESTDEYIKIDFKGVNLTYFVDEIESIDGKKVRLKGPEVSSKTIDKQDLLERMKNALRNITRFQRDEIKDMDIEGLLHSKTEEISDIDYENKILQTETQIKEYNFYPQGLRANLEAKLAEAKQKRLPAEKIQQTPESMDKLTSEMQKTMDKMAEKMKSIKSITFLVKETFYMRPKDRWIKIEFPSAQLFWKIVAESKQGNIDKESLNRIASALPASARQQFESLLTYLNTDGGWNDIQSISGICETDFLGMPCYALDIKNNETMDAMKKAILAYVETEDKEDVQASVDSFNYREFVSKDNYLRLGSQANLQMSFHNPNKTLASLKAFMKTDVIYNYPKGKTEIPPGLSSAILVRNEEELKNILMEDFKDMFQADVPVRPATDMGK